MAATKEKSLGLIATTSLNTLGDNRWGMVITDRRTIFVLISTNRMMYGAIAGGAVGGALGGALGAVAGRSRNAESRSPYEFWNASPDSLAAEKKSIVVEHSSVTEWRLRKRRFDDHYRIYFLYNDGGRKRKLYGTIYWTAAVPEKFARSDPRSKNACLRQAEAVQRAFADVLPASMMARFRGVE